MFRIFIILITLNYISAQTCDVPLIVENPAEKDDVRFDKCVSDEQMIYIKENIERPITIALLNYKGTQQPTITFREPSSGANSQLGAKIERKSTSDNWELVVTISQDYEAKPANFRYRFEVIAADGAQHVILYIDNVDDEPPYFIDFVNPCIIKEHYVGTTECVYTLGDEDGIMENTVKYTISDDNGVAKDTFRFTIDSIEDGKKQWQTTLETIGELDFETTTMHIFTFTVADSANHEISMRIVVQVEDIPDRDPVWQNVLSTQEILENTVKVFKVQATDGDIMVNYEINYSLDTEPEWKDFFSIGTETGEITVGPIDRDALGKEILTFTVIAYEVPDPSAKATQVVTIYVIDQNNNPPKISIQGPTEISIPENFDDMLEFQIEVNDIDLNENAMYEVSLIDASGNNYHEAFRIVPSRGYKLAEFSMSVKDSLLLDYENPEWQKITLEIYSKETYGDHEDRLQVKINLENLNDESPIFDQADYQAEIEETVGIGHSVITVKATDRDIGDKIKYTLLGQAIQDILHIDWETGLITTKAENGFDYERQVEVFVQVQAEDSLFPPYRKTIAQLAITVLDVNDEQPRIMLPNELIQVEENRENKFLVNENIIATDEDTSARLKFSINWEESYAMKNGRPASKETYGGCITVDTVPVDGKTGHVKAVLRINEIIPKNTPNYEEFETLYLSLVVEDEMQTVGTRTDTVRIAISIIDKNDNAPIFNQESINSEKNVVENANANILIAMVTAIDIDGPDYNTVRYSIRPADAKTPDWVRIDPSRGEILVKENVEIDADIPIWILNYEVTASDGELETKKIIKIKVIDTNDNEPKIVTLEKTSNVKEKSETGTTVQTIIAKDDDRDEPFNVVWFEFNSQVAQEVRTFFSIDIDTGKVYIDIKESDKELDRDFGTREFNIIFTAADNYDRVGNQQSVQGSFKIILTDINDQRPLIQTKSLQGAENYKKDSAVGEITAQDNDDPDTDNSKIDFKIVGIEKGEGAIKDAPEDLFALTDIDPIGTATLKTQYDLEGYYGVYNVKVKTNDFGDPQLTHEAVIPITVTKYNFKSPVFVYPEDEDALYLAREQSLNSPLYQFNGELLEPFVVSDQQTEKWDLLLQIDPASNPGSIFSIWPTGKNRGQLRLSNYPDYTRGYELNVIADCQCTGNTPYTSSITIHIRFIDETTEPYFETNEIAFEFLENTTGIEPVQLPKAYFNKEGEDWDEFNIYYFLSQDLSESFQVGKDTAELSLIKVLDREETPEHELKVVASKNANWNGNAVNELSVLTVSITVLDVNDNPPNFLERQYVAGIKPSDELNKIIRDAAADDLDSDDSMVFSIVEGSLKQYINGTQDLMQPFYVTTNGKTGNIHLNFSVKANMFGYFQFTMAVTDEAGQSDTVPVQVYIVSDTSRTTFRFENTFDDVVSKQDIIKEIFEDHLGYICNIDTTQKATNEAGEPIDTMTDVLTHFIDPESNLSLENSEIENKITGDVTVFANIRSDLLKNGLYLLSFAQTPFEGSNEETLLTWLIGISVGLGSLCLFLIVVFTLKTRSLSRRLNQMSEVKFTSQESGLNRIGVSAPNTNKHAIEGSNPVYNEEKRMPDIDTFSFGSGDSDLIGIEDNPNFDYSPEEKNNVGGLRNPRANSSV